MGSVRGSGTFFFPLWLVLGGDFVHCSAYVFMARYPTSFGFISFFPLPSFLFPLLKPQTNYPHQTHSKAGAAVGTQAFLPIQAAAGKRSTFFVAGGVGILGTIVYWFLPEGRDVDLAVMDEEFERGLEGEGQEET